MNAFKILNKQIFINDKTKIVPIRIEDRLPIMNWRNEQIYHLRQKKFLTEKEQNNYFDKVIKKIFNQEFPDQVLFSYLESEKCIGYGGLVHINWTDKNAEISFIIETALEKHFFATHWKSFLKLIEEVAFNEICLHKIFVYAFDLRTRLYNVLENEGYEMEARLKEHVFIENKFVDVVIYSKINKND